jgi:hypothetical protein
MSQLPTAEDTPEARATRYRAYAEQVVATGNLDYAIELYCLAIAATPDNITLHQELRELGLRRKAAGGRALGLFAHPWRAPTTEDGAAVADAARVLAYDPGNTRDMATLLASADALGLTAARDWIAGILRRATRE